MLLDGRIVVWFSSGAASACALKLMAPFKPLAVNCDVTLDEHSDNVRFKREVQEWTGVEIHTIGSKQFWSIEEVFEKKKYMAGIKGAPCTVEMKKVPRFSFQKPDDIHVFGYTADEEKRVKEFESSNPELLLFWPLVRARMTKQDCFSMLQEAGISRPEIYNLGFPNANCIGCVKASSPKYWNMVRKNFPEIFQRRCLQSRKFGAKLCRVKGLRIYLDELPIDENESIQEDLSCGPQCSLNPHT